MCQVDFHSRQNDRDNAALPGIMFIHVLIAFVVMICLVRPKFDHFLLAYI